MSDKHKDVKIVCENSEMHAHMHKKLNSPPLSSVGMGQGGVACEEKRENAKL